MQDSKSDLNYPRKFLEMIRVKLTGVFLQEFFGLIEDKPSSLRFGIQESPRQAERMAEVQQSKLMGID